MDIGEAVKSYRLEKDFTIRDLAAITGLSPGAISKIENGKTIPNVITIKSIANAMGVSVSHFFMEEEHFVEHVKKEERSILIRNTSEVGEVTEEMLSSGKDNNMQPGIITFSGGSNSGAPITHKGEEFTYVLEGEVLCVLEGLKSYNLKEGDTLYFPSSIPHRWENLSKTKDAKIMVVATPASF